MNKRTVNRWKFPSHFSSQIFYENTEISSGLLSFLFCSFFLFFFCKWYFSSTIEAPENAANNAVSQKLTRNSYRVSHFGILHKMRSLEKKLRNSDTEYLWNIWYRELIKGGENKLLKTGICMFLNTILCAFYFPYPPSYARKWTEDGRS